MYIAFVSVDKKARWSQWHSGPTDSVYFSDFYKRKLDVKKLIEQTKEIFPEDDNVYFIRSVILNVDPDDKETFKDLCCMMRAYDRLEPILEKERGKLDEEK